MIEEEHGRRPVRAMREALGIAHSAYYASLSRPESARQRTDRRLLVEIRAVYRESRQTFGALRVHAELRARGIACVKNRLSVVLDLYSRRVVGWSAQPSLSRRGLLEALTSAIRARRPAAGLVAHSDQGSQYSSDDYRALLSRHGLVASMSRRGNCLGGHTPLPTTHRPRASSPHSNPTSSEGSALPHTPKLTLRSSTTSRPSTTAVAAGLPDA